MSTNETLWKMRCHQAGFLTKGNSSADQNCVLESYRGIFCFNSAIWQCLNQSKLSQSPDDCSHVSVLNLSPFPELNDQSIANLIEIFPNLVSIKLDGMTKASHKAAKALIKCSHLKALSLLNCPLSQKEEINIILSEKALTNLKLSHCSIDQSLWSNISSCALRKLTLEKIEWNVESLPANRLVNLSQLKISSDRGPRIDALADFLKDLSQLGSLILSCSAIVSSKIVQSLPNSLDFIDLSWSEFLKDDDVQMLTTRCPHLTNLSLARCQFLTDKTLNHLKRLQDLSDINLSDCKLMTAEGLSALFANQTKLKGFNCTGCSVDQTLIRAKLTLDQIVNLALPAHFDVSWFKGSNLPKIRGLRMNGNISLDDNNMQTLLPILLASDLEDLDIIGCCITSCTFSKLMRLQKLKSLSLSGRLGKLLTIAGSEYLLLKRLPNLETLHISLARHINFEILKHLMTSCRSLKKIEIGPLQKITYEQIEQLRNLFPSIAVREYGYRGLPNFLHSLFFKN